MAKAKNPVWIKHRNSAQPPSNWRTVYKPYFLHTMSLHDQEEIGPGMAFAPQGQKAIEWRRWPGTPDKQKINELLKQARNGNRRAVKVLAQKFGVKFSRPA